MRQVPTTPFFALVGLGRVGRALAAYLDARKLPYCVLARECLLPETLSPVFASTHLKSVLLAVSDSSLVSVAEQLKQLSNVPLVHFSGSARVPGAHGFHPLYSFTQRALSPLEFEAIPFLMNPGEAEDFRRLLPDFINPLVELGKERDSFYHALCVLMGNLPTLIQDTSARALEKNYGVPREACLPFLKSLLANFAESSGSLVAGPAARKDSKTTLEHLIAVSNDAFLSELYTLLVRQSWPESGLIPPKENS